MSAGIASMAPRVFFLCRATNIRSEVATGSFVGADGLGATAALGGVVGAAVVPAGVPCACNVLKEAEIKTSSAIVYFKEGLQRPDSE